MELAWKTLKDYLEAQKFIEINSPKSVIKKAFETGLIKDGHGWMDALEDRNLTVHTYDEDKARDIECAIRNSYFPLLNS
jgi:nucleotidyltransferase substrate binding protein (TIGR01987 family)